MMGGRGRRTSPLENLIELASRLPWWVGCTLAVVSFVVLHSLSGIELAQPTGLEQIGTHAGKRMVVTMAFFGQFILPLAFGLGSLVSVVRGIKQRGRYAAVKGQSDPGALFDMTWQQFEGLVAEFFRRQGYTVVQTGGDGPDGGVDLVLTRDNDRYLVQCKQWKAYKVGVQTVRELYGIMAASGAAGGFLITAGEFTEEAKKFAQGLNIQMFNGPRLQRMIREMQEPASQEPPSAYASTREPDPVCPSCGRAMVKRIARKGSHSGREFWGCSGFPRCRQTFPLV